MLITLSAHINKNISHIQQRGKKGTSVWLLAKIHMEKITGDQTLVDNGKTEEKCLSFPLQTRVPPHNLLFLINPIVMFVDCLFFLIAFGNHS